MKKILAAVVAMLVTCSIGFSLDLVTSQDAHKTGLEGFRTKANAVINQLNGTGIATVRLHITTNDYISIVGTNLVLVHGSVTNVIDADITSE